jgi:hypothetical protein
VLPSESPPLPLTEVQTALALLVRRAVVENEPVLLITSGMRNEVAEYKNMPLRKKKYLTRG